MLRIYSVFFLDIHNFSCYVQSKRRREKFSSKKRRRKIFPHWTCSCAISLRNVFCSFFCTYQHKRDAEREMTRSFRPCPSGNVFSSRVDDISIATKTKKATTTNKGSIKNVAQNTSEWEGENEPERAKRAKISHKTQPVSCSCFTIACSSTFFPSSSWRCWLFFSCGRKSHEWCNFSVMSDCYRDRQFMQF